MMITRRFPQQLLKQCTITRVYYGVNSTLKQHRYSTAVCFTSPKLFASASALNVKSYSTNTTNNSKNNKEEAITQILSEQFTPKYMKVQDVSGGCGASFTVFVVSDKFKGMTPIKRHRAVHDVLKAQIKEIHSLSLELKTEEELRKKQ